MKNTYYDYEPDFNYETGEKAASVDFCGDVESATADYIILPQSITAAIEDYELARF